MLVEDSEVGGLVMSDTPTEPSIGRAVRYAYIYLSWSRDAKGIEHEHRKTVVVPALVTRAPYQSAGLWVVDLFAFAPNAGAPHVHVQGVPEGDGAGCWSKIPPADGW
jgi:hypothetical protein